MPVIPEHLSNSSPFSRQAFRKMWAGSDVDKAVMPRAELALLIQQQRRQLQRQQHQLEAQQEEVLKLRAELQMAKKRKREEQDPQTVAYMPGTCLSPVLGLQPSKTRSFPTQTVVIWVPGGYTYFFKPMYPTGVSPSGPHQFKLQSKDIMETHTPNLVVCTMWGPDLVLEQKITHNHHSSQPPASRSKFPAFCLSSYLEGLCLSSSASPNTSVWRCLRCRRFRVFFRLAVGYVDDDLPKTLHLQVGRMVCRVYRGEKSQLKLYHFLKWWSLRWMMMF